MLNGHAHSYERFAPQDPIGNADQRTGSASSSSGPAAKSLRNPGAIQPNSELYENNHYGVLKLVLKPNGYDWAFVNEGGTTVDSGSTLVPRRAAATRSRRTPRSAPGLRA